MLDGGGVITGLRERFAGGDTICGDGAWGTQLMARGLRPGDSCEALNLDRPEVFSAIGGCCGTGPDHIRAIRAAIDGHRSSAS